jgi:hypothetical protein
MIGLTDDNSPQGLYMGHMTKLDYDSTIRVSI